MVWYSQNTVPVVYATDNERSNIPNYRHMRVDEHWVWTEQYANRLRSLGSDATTHVVGPILWYLPEDVAHEIDSDGGGLRCQPCHGWVCQGNRPGKELLLRLEHDCLRRAGGHHVRTAATRLGQPILVLLKHKRGHSDVHDRGYLEVVKKLVDGGRIRLAPAQTNLYSLIAASSVAVAVPYSSPAQVAATLGVPAIYFDPTEQLVPTHDREPLISFASGPTALAATLDQSLSANVPSTAGEAGRTRLRTPHHTDDVGVAHPHLPFCTSSAHPR